MTRLVNDPNNFPAEALEGFVQAFSPWVKPVYGGVVRATVSTPGKVALVVGGGSGHYPAFAGWVGPGFADGAVAGNIFSSPSAQQAYSVCQAAQCGGGVLIGFGNYAGDVLHFGQAAAQLNAEGIETRLLRVTDDIASGPPEEYQRRRGIAGDLPVFKITAAACEAGMTLDEVERVFDEANRRTRSFGVAFSGCTLPGADAPLFSLDEGMMGVGLGIHGEPGVADVELGSADEVAQRLVEGLLNDRPRDSGARVVALLNGLGTTKYEELFVVYRKVAQLLVGAGLEVASADVGEFVTSLDMAGVSLTLVWLSDELEELWNAPCDTPAYRRGNMARPPVDTRVFDQGPQLVTVTVTGSPDSQEWAHRVVDVIGEIKVVLDKNADELGRLDAVAGDGDHGIGMTRGVEAALTAAKRLVDAGAGAKTTLVGAGQAWSDAAGGTSGALWGAMLTAFGEQMGDDPDVNGEVLIQALGKAAQAVQDLGGASRGDKTMLDALLPALDALNVAGPYWERWGMAAEAAQQGAESTKDLVAKVGRARPLGERSLGTPDAGAVSMALVLDVIARSVRELE